MLKQCLTLTVIALLSIVLLNGCTGTGLDEFFSAYPIDAQGGTIETANGNVKLYFPSQSVLAPVTVNIRTATDYPLEGVVLGTAYKMSVMDQFGQSVSNFGTPTLTLKYDPNIAVSMGNLKLYRLNEGVWQEITSTHNTDQHTLSGNITRAGTYAIRGTAN